MRKGLFQYSGIKRRAEKRSGPDLRGAAYLIARGRLRLEGEFRAELDRSRVTAHHLIPLGKQRVSRRQVARLAGMLLKRCVIDLARGVLRMVQSVVEISTELELHPLPPGKNLGEVEVDIIDWRRLQDVAAAVGVYTRRSLDELG